jgi:hypothetical protein
VPSTDRPEPVRVQTHIVEVKQRLKLAFLAPRRNPELRRLYAKNLRGGLLLYGSSGCGETFLAGALAVSWARVSCRCPRRTCWTDRCAPSTEPWQEAARNTVLFANSGDEYDELAGHLRRRHARHRQPAAGRTGRSRQRQRRGVRAYRHQYGRDRPAQR